VLYVWCVYCVVVCQHVIGKFCVFCGGVAVCYRYGICTVFWCGSVPYDFCRYCVVVWQLHIVMVYDLCGGVAACTRYGLCTMWLYGIMLYV